MPSFDDTLRIAAGSAEPPGTTEPVQRQTQTKKANSDFFLFLEIPRGNVQCTKIRGKRNNGTQENVHTSLLTAEDSAKIQKWHCTGPRAGILVCFGQTDLQILPLEQVHYRTDRNFESEHQK